MENEINLDLSELDQVEVNAENKLKVKNRFEKLSEKVITTSKERDEAVAKMKAEADLKATAERERDFYKGFSTSVSQYPQAAQYQDKIWEKVKGGYTHEDAMVAVLAKEGKLGGAVQQPIMQPNIAGGSAPTIMEGVKSISEMSSAEKLAALTEAEKSGELVNALRGR